VVDDGVLLDGLLADERAVGDVDFARAEVLQGLLAEDPFSPDALGGEGDRDAGRPIVSVASGTTVTPGIRAAARYSAAVTGGGGALYSRVPIVKNSQYKPWRPFVCWMSLSRACGSVGSACRNR
jgi:hypothetical protein